MSKVQTNLTNFRFLDTTHNPGMYVVEWYRLEENEDNSESYGTALLEEEVREIKSFMDQNPQNFQYSKESPSSDEYAPRCGNYDLNPIHASHPKNLILRRKPQMPNRSDTVFPCMDIQLLNEKGELQHNFHLHYDLIGKIIKTSDQNV
jgi:hypothetical protein